MYRLLSKTRFLRFAQFASGIGLVAPVPVAKHACSDLYGRFVKSNGR